MANCANRSALMHDWPSRVIPNPIDTDQWKPMDRALACSLLNLNPYKQYVVFGACGGISDLRKGGDLLVDVLEKLKGLSLDSADFSIELLIFGQDKRTASSKFPFPTQWFGNVDHDEKLIALYSAADVMLITSRQDNLPNTGLEAHACGTPIVTFDVGGMSDIVDHYTTGFLVSPFNTFEFASAIKSILCKRELLSDMKKGSRDRAVNLWNPKRIAMEYGDFYRSIDESYRGI
jgi:glycosyltransferase involved in cell wall biosynthesis